MRGSGPKDNAKCSCYVLIQWLACLEIRHPGSPGLHPLSLLAPAIIDQEQ